MSAVPSDPALAALTRRHPRHLWAGRAPPAGFTAVDLQPADNWRAAPEHHRAYDVVWSVEPQLSGMAPECLPLYLDELVRCVATDGRLVVRFSESETFTVVTLKRFLGRHPFLDCAVEHEAPAATPGADWTCVVRVHRRHLADYAGTAWTLAVLTRGDRVGNVAAFLRSVREQDPDREHELIVCGPPAPEYEPFAPRYLTAPPSAFADISARKNALADMATRPNLLVAHDRYTLDPGFFEGFARYGHDFDFCTVPQRYPTGEPFPAWCALSKHRHRLGWYTPIALNNPGRVYPLSYLNGGFLAVKTHTLRTLRFNPLLFWRQAEDVELATWLQAHSLPPRLNRFSGATVLGLTPAYTADFLPERADDREEDPPAPPRGWRAWVRRRLGEGGA